MVGLAANPTSLSPDGDGQADRAVLVMRADEAITGTARLIDRTGATVRRWTITAATAGDWSWNGRDAAGRMVADGRYDFRVRGLDRAGNLTVRDMTVRVDRTIKSLTWARGSFVPKTGQKDRVTMVLRRPATVTVAIYQGTTLVRTIWSGRTFAPRQLRLDVDRQDGRRGARQARHATGSWSMPTSWIGPSRVSRDVTVKAP